MPKYDARENAISGKTPVVYDISTGEVVIINDSWLLPSPFDGDEDISNFVDNAEPRDRNRD